MAYTKNPKEAMLPKMTKRHGTQKKESLRILWKRE